MAGDWIKMEVSTPDKPEVLAITVRLGWDDPDLTVGKLFRVWRWFDQHTTDGNAAGVTKALLDRIAGVSGFADAMQSVGWLLVSDMGLSLPNHEKHCGKTAKDRAQTAKRVATHKQKRTANADSVTESVSDALPREDKREEVNNPLPPSGVDEAEVIPACPYAEIVKAYAEELPTLPGVRVMDAKRQRGIRNRWAWVLSSTKSDGTRRATTAAEALRWFRDYFARVRANGWLMGETPSRGHEGWKADLDFLMTDRGLKAVLERTQVAA
jgi:hypothetical protein